MTFIIIKQRNRRPRKGDRIAAVRQLGLIGNGGVGLLENNNIGTPTGDGTMDFSIATGDDTGLLALIEDI